MKKKFLTMLALIAIAVALAFAVAPVRQAILISNINRNSNQMYAENGGVFCVARGNCTP